VSKAYSGFGFLGRIIMPQNKSRIIFLPVAWIDHQEVLYPFIQL
jgi:hypothetical protein